MTEINRDPQAGPASREQGREAAAAALWAEHYAPLAGWCASLLGDDDAARDVANEAFARLLARWVTVREPRGFLYVTATNLVRDQWRRQQRDHRLTDRLRPFTQTSTAAPETWLRDLVGRLPDRLRAPVLLHYYADLPVEEVARLLRRPSGTIKRALHDARAVLAREIEDPR